MIFLKGDTHADVDINDLSSTKFPEGRHLTKDDFVIILGDFGLGWITDYHLKWYKEKSFTTLVVRGNHDSTRVIDDLKEIDMFSSKVKVIYDSVYLLQDAHVYTIQGQTFFIMGGALSIDKDQRILGKSYWIDEKPSYKEFNLAKENLAIVDNKVDYILTHTGSHKAIKEIYQKHGMKDLETLDTKYKDSTCDMLDYFEEAVSYKHWYFGHFHLDFNIDEKHTCSYHKVVQLK